MNVSHKGLLVTLGFALGATLTTAHAEEKTLRLYNWADYFAEDTLSKFTAETGIKVIYDVMDGSEVLEAKLMTGGSGYDLIFPGDTVAERLMRAGSLQELDRSKITALADVEPGLQKLRTHYPHASKATVPFPWGTIGLTYNDEQIRKRMPDAPVDSLELLFKPELAAKFADCGISMIDSPDEALAVVLNYLGRDPRSAKKEDLAAASELLLKIRPYIRKFQSQPVTDLVNGNLCLSLGYSGDMTQAQRTADSASRKVSFQYRIPREGTTVWMDNMAIPVDAKHPEYAYTFINFVMRPENMAAISNFTGYPTSNAKARPDVDPQMRNNPDIYPAAEAFERLVTGKDIPQSDMRARMRVWTKFKTASGN
ncbi:extracellular solute-binding protein [Pseudomonas sp. P66]|uniref:Extracellular solute-binding protein n=1 Tax=Pseudomonas arcuscaelestis TaxID=2710591 RepID=A0ABS2C2C7_9PSED|nr:extracellular solute-binding protein [Pseudomonas arcuscaelestis]MBM5459381.1 extracellular solute-binding protein [Pseudomonas arcuscaelestis]